MRLLALLFLIIGTLGAQSAFAEDTLVQPLTRADCDSAGMYWDETSNVCAATSGHASGQPLTRADCDQAGMTWLLQSLLANGLVDELMLAIYPIVLGSGKRLFADSDAVRKLRLLDSKTTSTGGLPATYAPEG